MVTARITPTTTFFVIRCHVRLLMAKVWSARSWRKLRWPRLMIMVLSDIGRFYGHKHRIIVHDGLVDSGSDVFSRGVFLQLAHAKLIIADLRHMWLICGLAQSAAGPHYELVLQIRHLIFLKLKVLHFSSQGFIVNLYALGLTLQHLFLLFDLFLLSRQFFHIEL